MTETRSAQYFTTCDVARLRGVTPGAVRAAVDRGLIHPSARTASGVYLCTLDDVREYLARPRRVLREPVAA